MICYRFDNRRPSAWIENIFVLKDFRGYKVETRLVEFAKKLAQRKGCKGLSLIVGLQNPPALYLYNKCGFKIKEVGRASLELKQVRERRDHGRSRT